MLRHSKRAQVETQFNWIFVLFVGAIIMIFFVVVVMKQKGASEIKISETVMTDLQSIFTGGSVSTGTSQLIEVPEVEIGFDCANYYLKGVTKPAENLIIFAPKLVKGRNIVTWTLDYNLPYKITNFLYITTPEMRYIFVSDDPAWLKKMNNTLPKEMNKEFIESGSFGYGSGSIQDKNNYKVRMIFQGDVREPPKNLKEKMGADLTALSIYGDSLKFHECCDGNSFKEINEEYTYTVDLPGVLEPSLYGAIFTDDLEMYNCMIKKALKRAYFVSKVYAARNRNLTKFFESTNSYCQHFDYDPNKFDNFVRDINKTYEKFPDLDSINNILGDDGAKGIESKNKMLLQKSCPLIY